MRARDYLVVSWKDITRRVTRSLLTITALTISTVVVVSMLSISLRGQQVIAQQYGGDKTLSLITVTPSQAGGRLSPYGSVQELRGNTEKLDDDTVDQLLRIPHVTSAVPRAGIWELHHFSIDGYTKQFTAQAQGVASDTALPLVAGSFLQAGGKEVLLGKNYAHELDIDPEALVGKTITLTTQKGYRGSGADIPPANASPQAVDVFNQRSVVLMAKIRGVVEGVDQNAIILPMEWTRDIRTARFNEAARVKQVDQLAADGYSAIHVTVDAPENVATVSEAIKTMGYGQISIKEQVQRLGQFTTTMWVLLGAIALIAVISAALGVANTMLTAVSEQAYAIAVWRSVGARRSVVMRIFLTQALILGFIGGVLGTGIGVVLGGYINSYTAELLTTQGLGYVTAPVLSWWQLGAVVGLTCTFAVLAGIYPAYKAAKVDPSAALRSN